MHHRALELLQSRITPQLRKALDEFDKLVGSAHASVHAREIVEAAYKGRVLHLFLQESAEYQGDFDPVREKLTRHPDLPGQSRDLLNEAAIQVIRHGGTVSVLKSENMPHGVPVCALFRYAEPARTATT